MARMMGRNYRRGYCHCCNPLNIKGRTREKREWRKDWGV